MQEQQYAGFWVRVGATIIDSVLILLVVAPILTIIYGKTYWTGDPTLLGFWDLMFNYVIPAIAIIMFWVYKSATPGKMLLNLTIIDAKTGDKPSGKQFIGRYLAYYVSILTLMLGFLWVAVDRRKQGFHDKLAGTLVVRNQSRDPVEIDND